MGLTAVSGFNLLALKTERLKHMALNVVIHTFLILVSLSCLFPLWWTFSSSLKTQSTIFIDGSLFPSRPHWENYVLAWTKADFGVYFLNSVIYTVVVVLGVIFIGSMAAYAISRLQFPGKTIFFIILISTMMLPLHTSFVAIYYVLAKLHLINTRLGYLLPQINGGLALAIFLLKTFFDKLPKELEDSARIDGCGKFRVYWHVALPLARPALAVLAIFNILAVWNEYLWAMLILSGKDLMPLQRGLMVFQGAHMTEYPFLMAGIVITIVPVIALYLMLQKYIIRGITSGVMNG